MSKNLIALTELDDEELIPEILPGSPSFSIQATVSELRAMFTRAAAVTPTREVVPGTAYALLEGVPTEFSVAAHLRVTASSGTQTVSVSGQGKIKVPGRVLLPPKRILDIVKLAPEDVVDITVVGDAALIRSGRARWTVAAPQGAFCDLSDLADLSALRSSQIATEPFLRALRAVRGAASSTNARLSLMQILVKDSSLIACDGGRLHKADVAGLDPELHTTIPVQTADEILKALKDEETFSVAFDDNHLVIRVGDSSIVAQRLLVDYPNVTQLLLEPKMTNTNTLQVNRVELSEVVSRVRINSDPDYAVITLTTVRGSRSTDDWKLEVSSRDRMGNTASETVECYWSGSMHAVSYNHHHLADALDVCTSERITFKLGDDTKTHKTPLLVEDDEAGFTGVVQQITQHWT